MMESMTPILIGAIIGAILVVMFLGVVAAAWFYVIPAMTSTTTTTVTTSSTTTTTTTTTTTSSTTTTTTTSTTTTLPTFFVCEREKAEVMDMEVQCQTRDRLNNPTSDWHSFVKRSTVELTLDESIISSSYEGNLVKVTGDQCIYSIDECSFTVGQFQTCIKPIGLNETIEAKFVDPNNG